MGAEYSCNFVFSEVCGGVLLRSAYCSFISHEARKQASVYISNPS